MGFSLCGGFAPVRPLSILFPPDGLERTSWAQFVGRFHLLTIQFPIALILFDSCIRIAGRDSPFPYLQRLGRFHFGAGNFQRNLCHALGWCLARSGGYSGAAGHPAHVGWSLSSRPSCWLCWMLRGTFPARVWIRLLGLAVDPVGLVSWTGYRGGHFSQGENHLTEHMPTGCAIGGTSGEYKVRRDRTSIFFFARMWSPSSSPIATLATDLISRNRVCDSIATVRYAGRQTRPGHQGWKRQGQRTFPSCHPAAER